jgi:hypothetical protein
MRIPLRQLAAVAAVLLLLALSAPGCGSKFSLPPESVGKLVPPDSAFTFKGILAGLDDVTDLLITRSSGNQLLVVRGASADTRTECDGDLPGGVVEMYPLFAHTGSPPLSISFLHLFRPTHAAENGGLLFVFDAGDTCKRFDQPELAPHVAIYQIGTADTLATFSDTCWAAVRGLAAATDHTVYVSGTFRVQEPDEFGRRTLRFRDGIWRYKELDPFTHRYGRDGSWTVLEGTGTGFVSRQGGIAWGPAYAPYLWVADGDKQAIQKLAIETDSLSHGVYQFDGTTSGLRFQDPVDVAVDDSSYLYVVDRGSARVLRYHDDGDFVTFIQKVNLGILQNEPLLVAPVATAVLDTIVFVADPATGAALRYERRRPCPTCF